METIARTQIPRTMSDADGHGGFESGAPSPLTRSTLPPLQGPRGWDIDPRSRARLQIDWSDTVDRCSVRGSPAISGQSPTA